MIKVLFAQKRKGRIRLVAVVGLAIWFYASTAARRIALIMETNKEREKSMKLFATICLVVFFTTGCAHSVYDVEVDYTYDQAVSENLMGVKLDVAKFTDERGFGNPQMMMRQRNTYGQTTSGGWQAEKPISLILHEAVSDGLRKAQVNLDPSMADLKLSGELLDLDPELIMGLSEHVLTGKISAKFQLRDLSTGDLIWKDTFIGTAELKVGNGFGVMVDNALAEWLPLVLDDIVSDLLNDEYFLSKLIGQRERSLSLVEQK